MTVARWSSILIALTLLTPSAALAGKHHDGDRDDRDGRWDRRYHDDDDDRDDRRIVVYGDRAYGQYRDVAFNNGYADGVEKGREDAWNRNPFDFTHHLWYRGASRGYEGYGSHEEYREIYRDGFREGYEAGYGAQPAYGAVYAPGPVYAPAPVYEPAPRPRVGIHVDIRR